MAETVSPIETRKKRLLKRLLSGFALALALAFGVYLLLIFFGAGRPWFGSFWFLALLPALLCALICYIGDPDQNRTAGFYRAVPLVLIGIVDIVSALILHEGVICLLMLSPIWLASGWAGAFLLRAQRNAAISKKTLQSSFIVIPLIAGVAEAWIPYPHDEVVVTRSILVHASPDEIWPYTISNRLISTNEGRWTVTHNIIGLARPRATVMKGSGVGALRTAYWGDHIYFEERITQWVPGQRLGWKFNFSNSSLQEHVDEHIAPDGVFLKIDSGEYTLRPISSVTTELTLRTRYIAMTHVNLYARLWGELLMGDIESNVLTIIKRRSEAVRGSSGDIGLVQRSQH